MYTSSYTVLIYSSSLRWERSARGVKNIRATCYVPNVAEKSIWDQCKKYWGPTGDRPLIWKKNSYGHISARDRPIHSMFGAISGVFGVRESDDAISGLTKSKMAARSPSWKIQIAISSRNGSSDSGLCHDSNEPDGYKPWAWQATAMQTWKSNAKLGTYKASRFDSNSNRPSDSIRFESDWPIRKFSNRIGHACSFARRKLSLTTQTINGTYWYSI